MTDIDCLHQSCEHNRAGKCKANNIKIFGKCRNYKRLDGEQEAKAPFNPHCIRQHSKYMSSGKRIFK